MKLSLAIFAPLVALVQLCTANFDIYRIDYSINGNVQRGWSIFNSDPSCNDAVHGAVAFSDSSDVSGNKLGVRCVGACSRSDRADGISILEMHFRNNPLYHFTIYRDRGYRMYGLDGKVYGECILFPGNSYHCPGVNGPVLGQRKFRCLTRWNARELQGR